MWLWSSCVVCHRSGPSPCAPCVDALRPLAAGELCPPPDGLDGAAALCRYEGLATTLITSLKYGRHRDAVHSLGAALAVMGGTWLDGATVCWVPAAPANRAQRGFDQAELLARATTGAALRMEISPVGTARLLRRDPPPIVDGVDGLPGVSADRQPDRAGRTGDDRHGHGVGQIDRTGRREPAHLEGQTGRSRAERLMGPTLRPTGPSPARVVVIDDVTTTGASLSRAAMALRGAGARSVHALCVAATPYHPPAHR